MAENAVRGDRSVVFREVCAIARRAAGARDSRLCVDDNAARKIEVAGFDERKNRQQRPRGIAPRVRDERRPPDVVAIMFGQTVRRPGRECRSCGIPPRASSRVIA